MKYYFIINPKAGKGSALKLRKEIEDIATAGGIDFGIYTTKSAGDARSFAKIAAEQPGEKRIYACGGDGTLNEVANGVMDAAGKLTETADGQDASGADPVQIGCIPTGTGNDFVRNFPEAGDFTDIEKQIGGTAVPCDLLYFEMTGGMTGYSVNMFNIGFDANVVEMTQKMKEAPMMAGPVAYFTSVILMLAGKKGADLRVEYDDGFVFDDKLLMMAITNGCYCGGGVKGIPKARVDDGLIDVSLVKNVSRVFFLKMFPKYKEGTHVDDERAKKLLIYKKCKSLTVRPNGRGMKMCVDGEMIPASETKFTIVPHAVQFVLPEA